jgi:hypothetical protein
MNAEERIAEDCASVPLRAAGFVSKPISSHVPEGTFSIALCELCVAATIFSESGNVSVPNSGPIPK